MKYQIKRKNLLKNLCLLSLLGIYGPQTGALSEQTSMQQVAQPQSPPQVDIAEKLNAQGFTSTKYGEIFVWQQGKTLQVAQISDLFKKLIGNKIATLIDIDDTVLREERDYFRWDAFGLYTSLTGQTLNGLAEKYILSMGDIYKSKIFTKVESGLKINRDFIIFLYSALGMIHQGGLTEHGWLDFLQTYSDAYFLSAAHSHFLSHRVGKLETAGVRVFNPTLPGTHENTKVCNAKGEIIGYRLQNIIHNSGPGTIEQAGSNKVAFIQTLNGYETAVLIDNEDRHLSKALKEIEANPNINVKHVILIHYKAPEAELTELEKHLLKLCAGAKSENIAELNKKPEYIEFVNGFEAHFTSKIKQIVEDYVAYKSSAEGKTSSRASSEARRTLEATQAAARSMFILTEQHARSAIESDENTDRKGVKEEEASARRAIQKAIDRAAREAAGKEQLAALAQQVSGVFVGELLARMGLGSTGGDRLALLPPPTDQANPLLQGRPEEGLGPVSPGSSPDQLDTSLQSEGRAPSGSVNSGSLPSDPPLYY